MACITEIFIRIARSFPNLGIKLKQAGMKENAEEFVRKTAFASFYMTTAVVVFLGAIFLKMNVLLRVLYFVFPMLFVILFFYFLQLPEYRIRLKEKDIEREIVFACRFLIIELESGVPLYNALNNVSKTYRTIGRAFKEIIENIDLGSAIEDAIEDAITMTPSQDFRKVLWQILNSLKTGAEVSSSLGAVVDQITREQVIKVNEYGRRLNPIAMFYMMIAVILPSLGVTMLIVLSSFLAFELSLFVLVVAAVALGFLQFMFIAIIRSTRPAVEL